MPNAEKDLELEKLKGDPNMWMRLTMLSEDGETMKSVFTDKENPFVKNSAGAMNKIQSLAAEGKLYLREEGRSRHFHAVNKDGDSLKLGEQREMKMESTASGTGLAVLMWLSKHYFRWIGLDGLSKWLGFNGISNWFEKKLQDRRDAIEVDDRYSKEYKAMSKEKKKELNALRKHEKIMKKLEKIQKEAKLSEQTLNDLRGQKTPTTTQQAPTTTQQAPTTTQQTPTTTQQAPTMQQSIPTPPQQSIPTPPQQSIPTPPQQSIPTPPQQSIPTPPQQSIPTPPQQSIPTPPQLQAPLNRPPEIKPNENTMQPTLTGDVPVQQTPPISQKTNQFAVQQAIQQEIPGTKKEENEQGEKAKDSKISINGVEYTEENINELPENIRNAVQQLQNFIELYEREQEQLKTNAEETGPLIDEDSIELDEGPLIDEDSIEQDEGPLIDEDSIELDEGPLIDEDSIELDEGPLIDEDPIELDEGPLIDEDSIELDEGPLIDEDSIELDEGPLIDEDPIELDEGPLIDEDSIELDEGPLIDEDSDIQKDLQDVFKDYVPQAPINLEDGFAYRPEENTELPFVDFTAPLNQPPEPEPEKVSMQPQPVAQYTDLQKRLAAEKEAMESVVNWQDRLSNTLFSNGEVSTVKDYYNMIKDKPDGQNLLAGTVCGLLSTGDPESKKQIMEGLLSGKPLGNEHDSRVNESVTAYNHAVEQMSQGNREPMTKLITNAALELGRQASQENGLSSRHVMIGRMISNAMSLAHKHSLQLKFNDEQWATIRGAAQLSELAQRHHNAKQLLGKENIDMTSKTDRNAARDLLMGNAVESLMQIGKYHGQQTTDIQILMGCGCLTVDKLTKLMSATQIRKDITGEQVREIMETPNGFDSARMAKRLGEELLTIAQGTADANGRNRQMDMQKENELENQQQIASAQLQQAM